MKKKTRNLTLPRKFSEYKRQQKAKSFHRFLAPVLVSITDDKMVVKVEIMNATCSTTGNFI